ncbi:anaphase-promoting complex component Cut20/Apc4 [Purpureocillium lavendulum]|uniref:Anaphase-promoting complex subunit 4 n=1 Tax=Purpureocillium lavendulum TaxID=1247861 RepID=A0AB34FZF4_9HYPO|nr:anaphase-promoting complex component Cut20/Apc4 [Purpureocillium lavendulum]
MAPPKELAFISETEFESRAPNGLPASCPTLDLAATWEGSGKNLLVYRPPGQVVSRIHQLGLPGKKAPEAVAVTWRPDGQFLAVGWTDGVVRLMGLENNKAAHHIPVSTDGGPAITHIGWTNSNISNKKATQVASTRFKDELAKEWDSNKLPLDLPTELTFLEVQSNDDATVFTLRTGIDFLFQMPKKVDHDRVDVMVVGTSDGKIQLSIHDSFVIGTFQCPAPMPSRAGIMTRHASHPEVSTQALILTTAASSDSDELHLVPVDLPFIFSSPINLSLLTSKLTMLQTLLRYLKQTQLHMSVEWKNARELPSRFLRSVQGDLEEMQTGPKSIVPALYHTVLTGHVYEPVREWLVDSLAERGHKRWDKAVMSGLENLRSLVHENFLPALERCAIILSRLRGLAHFHKHRDDIGFSAMQISRIIDIVGCLTLVGHKILTHVMDELEHFTAFSTWLRFQIDRLASSPTDELTEKEATMDTCKVLTYIEMYLTGSPLDVFFDDITKEDYTADWEHCEDGPSLLDMLDKQLRKHESGQPSMRALPHVDFLVNYMTTWSSRIFKDIAEARKRSVRFGKPVPLSLGRPVGKIDCRVCRTEEGGVIYTALAAKEPDGKVYVFRVGVEIINGISTNSPATACAIDLSGRRLIDLKFLNDETLIIACSKPDADNTPVVISVPMQSSSLPFAALGGDGVGDVPAVPSDNFQAYHLPEEHAMKPVRMEVHDRSDVRGEVPTRVCFLASNRTTWRTFSVPSS